MYACNMYITRDVYIVIVSLKNMASSAKYIITYLNHQNKISVYIQKLKQIKINIMQN